MNPIDELLSRRVDKILPSADELKKQLESGKKLRLYQGYDPTFSRLHLGHTVGMRKLMDFANAGHEVVMLFGTGTVLVGDPSLRDTGRKQITQEEIDTNIKGWQDMVSPIVDFEKINIKQNGDWLTKLTLKDIINIASNISAVQLFKRESFTRRIANGQTVWYHETMYPLLQGYDSVVMDVDLEIGGTDQEFNMLVGRELQRKMNNREKFVLTVPMIMGTDGQQMSKTTGNCIWLDDTAEDMYGKIMSLSDSQIESYWRLLTDLPMDDLEDKIKNQPLDTKKQLAFDIARQFHGEQGAKAAADQFQSTVQDKVATEDVEIKPGQYTGVQVAQMSGITDSSSQIKRVFAQGGVQLNDKKILDGNDMVIIKGEETFKYGKKFIKKIKESY